MESILDILHQCAARYKENEARRVAKKKKRLENSRAKRKEKYNADKEYHDKVLERQNERNAKMTAEEKLEFRKKNTESARRSREKYKRLKKEFGDKTPAVDKAVERAKEYLSGNLQLFDAPNIISIDERATCYSPWCMHNVNGRCIHRNCITK